MGLPKGRTNNKQGRPKGIYKPEVATIRDYLQEIVLDNLDKIQNDLNKLEPKDRHLVLDKMMSYCIP